MMGTNPSADRGEHLPVGSISLSDAQDFIRALNALNDGYSYRLPSEAEWECACRAGTAGDDVGESLGKRPPFLSMAGVDLRCLIPDSAIVRGWRSAPRSIFECPCDRNGVHETQEAKTFGNPRKGGPSFG